MLRPGGRAQQWSWANFIQVVIAQSPHPPRSLCRASVSSTESTASHNNYHRQAGKLRPLDRFLRLPQKAVSVTLEAKALPAEAFHAVPLGRRGRVRAGAGAAPRPSAARAAPPAARGVARQRGGRGGTDPRPWPPRRARRRRRPAAPAPSPKRESPGREGGWAREGGSPWRGGAPGDTAVPGLGCCGRLRGRLGTSPEASLPRPGRPSRSAGTCARRPWRRGTGRTRVRARKRCAGEQLVPRKFTCSCGCFVKSSF